LSARIVDEEGVGHVRNQPAAQAEQQQQNQVELCQQFHVYLGPASAVNDDHFCRRSEAGMMAATSARRLWLNKAVSQPLRAGLYARVDHRREV
jgi:hypothetical protein